MVTVKHTIVALVEDKPGVLARVVGMFRRRGFNIASLAVGHSEVPDQSRMTFVVEGDDATLEQVVKQLNKLIEVVRVVDLPEYESVYRELAMIKVRAAPQTRGEIIQMADIFRASIVDVGPDSLIIEVTGDEDKIDSLNELLKPFGVREMMRTGRVAMTRGLAGIKAPVTARARGNGATHARQEEKYESIL